MTGLNDVVWFGSWLLTLLFQGTVTALIASILSFFFIFEISWTISLLHRKRKELRNGTVRLTSSPPLMFPGSTTGK